MWMMHRCSSADSRDWEEGPRGRRDMPEKDGLLRSLSDRPDRTKAGRSVEGRVGRKTTPDDQPEMTRPDPHSGGGGLQDEEAGCVYRLHRLCLRGSNCYALQVPTSRDFPL